ncbi:hypothetical protein HY404_00015 [Candidatus Microgenomates bacterium]|nr:hypothetical protein [Candidatus Microgenomates bacterium]
MGIIERMAQIQAETAAKELADKQETERRLQEAEVTKLQAQELKIKQDWERKQTIISELSPILEVVKAREHLEEVRNTVFHIGEVDPQPAPSTPPFG